MTTRAKLALAAANKMGSEKKQGVRQRKLPPGSKRRKKFKQNEIVVYYPNHEPDSKHPLEFGEKVLYLGPIANAPGHCVVAKWSGLVVWMLHPDDFRTATEEEL